MNKLIQIWTALRRWLNEDHRSKYVDEGILDLSGQGRDKYGNYKED